MSRPETVQISIHKALLIDRNFCILGGKHRDLSRILSASASASCSQSLYGTQHIWENSLLCGGGPGRGMQGRSDEPAAPDVAAPPTGGDPERGASAASQPAPSRSALTCAPNSSGEGVPSGKEQNRPTEPRWLLNNPLKYLFLKIIKLKTVCIHRTEHLVLNVLFPLKCLWREECVNNRAQTLTASLTGVCRTCWLSWYFLIH